MLCGGILRQQRRVFATRRSGLRFEHSGLSRKEVHPQRECRQQYFGGSYELSVFSVQIEFDGMVLRPGRRETLNFGVWTNEQRLLLRWRSQNWKQDCFVSIYLLWQEYGGNYLQKNIRRRYYTYINVLNIRFYFYVTLIMYR